MNNITQEDSLETKGEKIFDALVSHLKDSNQLKSMAESLVYGVKIEAEMILGNGNLEKINPVITNSMDNILSVLNDEALSGRMDLYKALKDDAFSTDNQEVA